MKDIETRLLEFALFAGLVAAAIFFVRGQYADLQKTRAALTAAQTATAARDTTIRQMLERDRLNDLTLKNLEATRAGIQSTLDLRETTIRNLERENAEMRTWAVAPLPSPVVRLLDHPQLTGAAAYRERMSASSTVQPAGGVGHK